MERHAVDGRWRERRDPQLEKARQLFEREREEERDRERSGLVHRYPMSDRDDGPCASSSSSPPSVAVEWDLSVDIAGNLFYRNRPVRVDERGRVHPIATQRLRDVEIRGGMFVDSEGNCVTVFGGIVQPTGERCHAPSGHGEPVFIDHTNNQLFTQSNYAIYIDEAKHYGGVLRVRDNVRSVYVDEWNYLRDDTGYAVTISEGQVVAVDPVRQRQSLRYHACACHCAATAYPCRHVPAIIDRSWTHRRRPKAPGDDQRGYRYHDDQHRQPEAEYWCSQICYH